MKGEELNLDLSITSGKLPIIYQVESSECGLACIAMISSYYGHEYDLYSIRKNFGISSNGSTLEALTLIASRIGFHCRSIALEIDEIEQLQLPAIIHWDFNHFVVLKQKNKGKYIIHDPAQGKVELNEKEFGEHFTGVALELTPNINFEVKKEVLSISLKSVIGQFVGLKSALAKIFTISLGLELLLLTTPFFSQWIIDNVIPSRDNKLLVILALVFSTLILMQELTKTIRSWFVLKINLSINYQWSINVFKHLMSLPVEYFEKRHIGDVVSRFGSIHEIQSVISTVLLTSLLDGLLAISVLTVMFLYSPILTLCTILLVILYAVIRAAWYLPFKKATEKNIIISAKKDSFFLESIRGIRSIKMFSMLERRATLFSNLTVEQMNAEARTKILGIGYEFSNGVIFGLYGIFILTIGAWMAIDQKMTIGMLMAFSAFGGQFTQRMIALIESYIAVKMLSVQTSRLADIVLAEPEVKKENIYEDVEFSNYSIKVENLSFKYSESLPYVFKNVNFEIKAGESVAIIGPSGCGKTTLMKIILGILKPSSGKVLIGGHELSSIPLAQRRRIIATVMQDDSLLSGSISDNITVFSENKDIEKMQNAAKLAGIYLQIKKMPMQFHTLIGDMGATLSGGQKQRVLLARAIYAEPNIMILDEATSHLDVESEHIVNQSIKSLNISRMIIAHRPETIAMADRIIDFSVFCI